MLRELGLERREAVWILSSGIFLNKKKLALVRKDQAKPIHCVFVINLKISKQSSYIGVNLTAETNLSWKNILLI